VDGGSTDDTLAKLQTWQGSGRVPLRVLVEPGANIAQGRNTAIAAARGPVIASTDAGVDLERDWLSNLVQPFEAAGAVDAAAVVACGFFVPDTRTAFETALGATTLPALKDINPQRFLPSSRSVAFPKAAWAAIGGYPEWLDYCEDLILDLRLREQGCRFVFVPDAVARFRPRSNLGAFFRQYYRYARGDGKADLWRWKHVVRYLTYLVGLPVLLWLTLTRSIGWALLLLLGAAAVLFTPYKRLLPKFSALGASERLKAILWVPVIRATGDIAKMLGYPVGLWWRWRHRREIPNWRQ